MRVNKDIDFIKKCKADDLDPIFAETRVSLKHGNKKLRQKKNYYSRKISEAIAIKKNKPSLNKQDMSVPIVLFN